MLFLHCYLSCSCTSILAALALAAAWCSGLCYPSKVVLGCDSDVRVSLFFPTTWCSGRWRPCRSRSCPPSLIHLSRVSPSWASPLSPCPLCSTSRGVLGLLYWSRWRKLQGPFLLPLAALSLENYACLIRGQSPPFPYVMPGITATFPRLLNSSKPYTFSSKD